MLEDLLTENLNLVVVGTAAGTRSAALGYYYAKPTNRFWRTLFAVGLTAELIQPADYRTLLNYGIGLTDLVKTKAGMDKNLKSSDFDIPAFEKKIRRFRPKIVCFNGKKAGTEFLAHKPEYGQQKEALGGTQVFVAHSTSGANGWWQQESWEYLAQLVKSL